MGQTSPLPFTSCHSSEKRPDWFHPGFALNYRPQRSRGKVIFSEACVKNSVHGGGGGCIPACIAGLQVHTQGGSWGFWPGGSPGPHPGGKLRVLVWGVSRPTPGGGEVEASGLRSLQAHTWGSLQAHIWRGVSRPTPRGGSQAHTWEGYSSMHWGRHPPPSRRLLLLWYASYWNAFLLSPNRVHEQAHVNVTLFPFFTEWTRFNYNCKRTRHWH